jgi:uncharacterized protein (DUF433 family)
MAVDTELSTREEELIARHIEPDPHKPERAEARVVGSGVHVWALIPHLQAENGDLEAAAAHYDLTTEQVEAAAAYYRRNQSVIDARIEANAE